MHKLMEAYAQKPTSIWGNDDSSLLIELEAMKLTTHNLDLDRDKGFSCPLARSFAARFQVLFQTIGTYDSNLHVHV